MIERFLVEVLRNPNALRATCMKCGSQVRLYSSPIHWALSAALYDHVCDAEQLRRAQHEHWREIVRDALLAGRDAEAIEIICHELHLVSP